jgi:hypothetical protein
MSLAKRAKTQAEFDTEAILQYVNARDGAFPMEELADKLLKDGWKVPIPSQRRILTRRLTKQARELREVDPQNRKVRSMHAKRIHKIGPRGKEQLEIVWDHINRMDWHHALTSFQQRFDNHQRQDRALDRDIASFNDNNPSATEHKLQKEMLFMADEREEQIVEKIEQDAPKKKRRKKRKPR